MDFSPHIIFVLKCNMIYMLPSKQQAQRKVAKLLNLMNCTLR